MMRLDWIGLDWIGSEHTRCRYAMPYENHGFSNDSGMFATQLVVEIASCTENTRRVMGGQEPTERLQGDIREITIEIECISCVCSSNLARPQPHGERYDQI